MEFMSDENVDGAESPSQAPKEIRSSSEGDDKILSLGELETAEAWPEQLGELEKKRTRNGQWLHCLKVLGRQTDNFQMCSFSNSIAEKKVLPCAVLIVSMIYTSVAATFYFE